MVNEADVRLFADKCKAIFEQVGRDIIGQEDIVELTVIAMIAGGNVLLEGVPGIGKTRLIRSLGRVFSLPFSRIQFTPDLMPADITGTNVLEKDEKGNAVYTFRPGPIFSHIVLADEINRATPKSQSALLEAMQEHTVTVDGKDYRMEEPFFVLATQNPIEQEGTYALPEAQVDRFMFKLLMRYPTVEEMKQIVEVAHASGVVVKAMLEFGYITTPELKAKAAQLACEAGIDWVKQSSGWGVGGCPADVEDVKILKANIELPCRVKVSGKVNTLEKMKAMFEAGAELVGTSSGPAIVDGLVGDINAY